ncbi:hypothetical protein SAMD00019534_102080 [Acytostelium subglobosum LB1]|uniref:hypothetical protein n=1 Tax=Acytostelium subglobosum LB1 TaxID=1410327 RepID=UPI00064487F5|nr:hypothetical protein SAMD00019534_102080 [Acytostelium subglobosum LB1]GAM27033.1 hypothetical protein SAMD00019534_102080 [Acytostelium subglobosum LB1]|eukprot:XP_012749913.1 hypothetical protein SAMD00019534_102080 [Acytostelium subglobosum LB1]
MSNVNSHLKNWNIVTSAAVVTDQMNNSPTTTLLVYYFGTDDCIGCQQIHGFLETLPAQFPNAIFNMVAMPSDARTNNLWMSFPNLFPCVVLFKNFKVTQKQLAFINGANPGGITNMIQSHY